MRPSAPSIRLHSGGLKRDPPARACTTGRGPCFCAPLVPVFPGPALQCAAVPSYIPATSRRKQKHFDMLTKKGKYGLKALIHLARLEVGETAFVADIAAKNNISKKFLDTILLELRNGGLLRSKKGPGGGYALGKPARDIFIGQAIRILDGPLAPIRCASKTAFEPCDDCDHPEDCQIRAAMTDVRDAIATILDNMTLEELVSKNSPASEAVTNLTHA